MPYIVPAGTRAKVIKPGGKAVEPYICRRNTSFEDGAMRRYGAGYLEFRRDGWRLIVPESRVIRVEVRCG
jgi:hypothetical protein